MKRLEGKVAIVTGAGRGIGRAYALGLAAQGARVVVNDLGGDVHGRGASQSPADEVVQEVRRLGGDAVVSYEDVADFQGAGRNVQTALDAFGRLDIVITNAGIERRGFLYDITEDDWDAVQHIHAKGSWGHLRHAVPVMREHGGGSIVFITSGAAWGGTQRIGAYAAAKGAIISLMLTASTELRPFNINVNCLSPGLTGTRLMDDFFSDLKETQGLTEADIAGRLGAPQQPENMVPMAVFLSADENRHITGRIFEVAGDRINLVNPPTRAMSFVKPGAWTVEDVFASFPRAL